MVWHCQQFKGETLFGELWEVRGDWGFEKGELEEEQK